MTLSLKAQRSMPRKRSHQASRMPQASSRTAPAVKAMKNPSLLKHPRMADRRATIRRVIQKDSRKTSQGSKNELFFSCITFPDKNVYHNYAQHGGSHAPWSAV